LIKLCAKILRQNHDNSPPGRAIKGLMVPPPGTIFPLP